MEVSLQRVADDFGKAFATEIFQIDADREWTGPLTSHYGVHLVRVQRVTPAHGEDFGSVVDSVRNDFDLVRREEAFSEYLAELQEQYTVRSTLVWSRNLN